ncbi:MAG: hypothetical protein, partial [Olavius algarvensis Gamma 1 endosymbiont]
STVASGVLLAFPILRACPKPAGCRRSQRTEAPGTPSSKSPRSAIGLVASAKGLRLKLLGTGHPWPFAQPTFHGNRLFHRRLSFGSPEKDTEPMTNRIQMGILIGYTNDAP